MIVSVICISSRARIGTRNTGSRKMYAWRQTRRSAWLSVYSRHCSTSSSSPASFGMSAAISSSGSWSRADRAEVPGNHGGDLFSAADARHDHHRSPHDPCHRRKKRGRGAVPREASNLRERGAIALEGDGTSPHHLLSEAFNAVVGRWTGPVHPVDAHDACVAWQHHGSAGHRLGPVRTEISGRHNVAGRGCPGGGRLCDRSDFAQLAGGQLSRLGRMPPSVNRVAALLLALDEFDRDDHHQVGHWAAVVSQTPK